MDCFKTVAKTTLVRGVIRISIHAENKEAGIGPDHQI